MSFYWFDVAGAAVMLAFAAFSWFKGFIREAFSALSWIGGYFAAASFYPPVSKFFQRYAGRPVLSDALAFFSVFAAVFLLVRLTSWIVREKLGLKNLSGWADGAAGGLMGALKGALFISVLLIPLNYFPSIKSEFMAKSYVAQLVSGVSALCYPLLRLDAAKTERILKEDINKLKPALAPTRTPAKAATQTPTPTATPKPNANPGLSAKEADKRAEAKIAPTPVVKKSAPVIKNRPEAADEGGMDEFVKSLH